MFTSSCGGGSSESTTSQTEVLKNVEMMFATRFAERMNETRFDGGYHQDWNGRTTARESLKEDSLLELTERQRASTKRQSTSRERDKSQYERGEYNRIDVLKPLGFKQQTTTTTR